MHKLGKYSLPENQKALKSCDICLQEILGTHYTCECDFDICKKCHD